ncbi:MAG TPA: hypothetical protein VEO00_03275 [Actinomycetota bacterium]|nr:hypothetical protein [Actinomycetota bacterium]
MAESTKRGARSGGTPPGGGPRPAGEEGAAPSRVAHDGGAGTTRKRGPVNCDVALCPVSLILTATGSVQPEAMEHLLAAGRELMLAVKAVIDARAEGWTRTSPLEKIVIE